MVARFQATEALGTVGGPLDFLDGLLHGVLDGDDVALEGVLGNLKQFALGFLHQVIHVDRLVKGQLLHLAAVADELAGKVLLCHDARMELNVGGTRHHARQLADADGSAHLVQRLVGAQLVGHGEHVDGLAVGGQRLDGLIDLLVRGVVECLGLEDFAHVVIGVSLQHQCAQHGILERGVLGRQFAEFADDFGLMGRARATARLLAYFKFFHYLVVLLS